jgi:hypothetical protein
MKTPIACLVLLGALACGLDEQYTGMGQGALPGDPLYPKDVIACGTPAATDATNTPDISGGTLSVADLNGYAWRFDSLVVTAPLQGMIASTVNGVISDKLGDDSINLLLVAGTDDRGAGTLAMTVGSATQSGTSWTLDGTGTSLPATLSGATFQTTTPGDLTIPLAGMFDPPATGLPIRQMKLTGRLAADASKIDPGALTGALTKADADVTKLGGTSLSDMLSQYPLNLDTDGDGTMDAWLFTGTFTAVEATLAK